MKTNYQKRISELEERVSALENIINELKNQNSQIPHQQQTIINKIKYFVEFGEIYIELRNQIQIEDLFNFDEAINRIDNLNKIKYGNLNNWRLPFRDELQKIMNLLIIEQDNNLIKEFVLPNKFQPIFWSSTEEQDSPKVWIANFKHGFGNFAYKRHNYYSFAVANKL